LSLLGHFFMESPLCLVAEQNRPAKPASVLAS
jgi:hypothetical protein